MHFFYILLYSVYLIFNKINQLDSRLEDDEVAEAEIEKMKLSRDKKITLVDIAKRHQKPSIDIDETITDLQVKINKLSVEDLENLGLALLDFTSKADLVTWLNNKANLAS